MGEKTHTHNRIVVVVVSMYFDSNKQHIWTDGS